MSSLYGGVIRMRRAWYEARPEWRRRLPRPVISVGNLVLGGSGKTPAAAHLARLLRRMGERPAILSRGYARRRRRPDLIVVSDGHGVRAGVEQSGDEPQMLARDLPGVPVIVAADRYQAGLLACERFDATVLVLDDGYQHLRLARDLDLLIVGPRDLTERMLPLGRLREPLSASASADALLVAGSPDDVTRVSDALHVPQAFRLATIYHGVRAVGSGAPLADRGGRAVAVAGVARPDRFFDALRVRGWTLLRECAYGDHHWYTAAERRAIVDLARAVHADAIVTTAKDVVRFEALPAPEEAADGVPWAVLSMEVAIEPADIFVSWLSSRLAGARR